MKSAMKESKTGATVTIQNGPISDFVENDKSGEASCHQIGDGDSSTQVEEDDASSDPINTLISSRIGIPAERSGSGEYGSYSSSSSSSSSACSSSSSEAFDRRRRKELLQGGRPAGSPSESLPRVSTPPPAERRNSQPNRTPVYNPFTNYSPNRQSRREVMGMSLFTASMERRPRVRPMYRNLESDHALEAYAQKIRSELRYAEMVELAFAAEQAAEDGQESFAARPSTFGMEDKGSPSRDDHTRRLSYSSHGSPTAEVSPSLKRPEWRRHRSLPTRGVSPALLGKSAPATKLTVTALRDVQEVFPSFQQFHTHLRTHLVRDGVKQASLIFREDVSLKRRLRKNLKLPMEFTPSGSERKKLAPRGPRINFLQNLGIKEWVGVNAEKEGLVKNGDKAAKRRERSGSFQRRNEEDIEKGRVGELVSGHFHSGQETPISRPPIKAPQGLLAGGGSKSSTKSGLPSKRVSDTRVAETVVATTSSSSEDDGCDGKQSALTEQATTQLSPRTLFDEEGADSIRGSRKKVLVPLLPSPVPSTPKIHATTGYHNTNDADEGPDFVTPARLRTIRSEKPKNVAPMPSLLLPSNSVLESPERAKASAQRSVHQPLLDISEAIRESESRDSSILLPMQLSEDRDTDMILRKTASQNDVLNLSSSQTGDFINLSGSDSKFLDIYAASRENSIARTPSPGARGSSEAPSTPPASKRGKYRTVKVSVFAPSPSTLTPTPGKDSDRSKTLHQSNVLVLGDDGSPGERKEHELLQRQLSDAIQTPQPDDCGCLSLSPAASTESIDSFHRKQESTLFSSLSPTALKAMEDPQLWNPFKEVKSEDEARGGKRGGMTGALYRFTRLSPRSRLFDSRNHPLYYRQRENDDFLNNYLYCSRPGQEDENPVLDAEDDGALCSEPVCQDIRGPCGGPCSELLNPDGCCAAILGEATMDLAQAKRSQSQQSFVSVGGSGPLARSQAETWFDMATERFDAVLEQLTGSDKQESESHWNVSFQAPSLKKSVGGSKNSSTANEPVPLHSIVENKSDGDGQDYDADLSRSKEKESDTIGLSKKRRGDLYSKNLYVAPPPAGNPTLDSDYENDDELVSKATF